MIENKAKDAEGSRGLECVAVLCEVGMWPCCSLSSLCLETIWTQRVCDLSEATQKASDSWLMTQAGAFLHYSPP